MADIFDLAQKINAQRQRASQGYSSPLEMLPLQIGQLIATRDKEKRVSLKQDATILNNLIQGATTEAQIANAEKATEEYFVDIAGDPSLKLYKQVVQSNIKTRRDAYNQGKNSLDWIDQKMNEEVPDYEGVYEAVTGFEQSDRAQRHNNPGAHIWTPELETKYGATKGDSFTDSEGKEYYTAHYDDMEKGTEASKFVVKKIWDNSGGDTSKFVKDYSGSSDESTLRGYEDAVNGKVGKGSYFNYSVETMRNWGIDDIESRIRELDKFERGITGFVANKFKYGKGSYSDTTLMKEYKDYRDKLDATMKAHLTAGIISEEEALSIMRGTYKTDKIEIIKTIDKNIKGYDSAISGLSGRKWDMMEENAKNELLTRFGAEGAIGLAGADFQKKITETIKDLQGARSKEYKRKHLWTGREKDAMGADFMKHQLDGDSKKDNSTVVDDIDTNIGKTVSQSWLNNTYDMAYKRMGLSKEEVDIHLANYNSSHDKEITKGGMPSNQTLLNYFKKNEASLVPAKEIKPVKGYNKNYEIENYWNENVQVPKSKYGYTKGKNNLPNIGIQDQGGGKYKFLQVKDGKWEIYNGKTVSMDGVKVPMIKIDGKKYFYDYKKGEWK